MPKPRIYLTPKMAALAAVGFASGLPLALTGTTLQAWMTDAGVGLAAIGLFALVKVPYNIKFLWAPIMDRFVPPLLGRRRGWLIVTQALVALCIAAMAFLGPGVSLHALAIAALAVAFFSASQDIVADAYRTDILPPAQRGAGAAVFITGYRLAYIATAAGALYVVGKYGLAWRTVYLLSAALMLVGFIATWLAPEPIASAPAPATLRAAVVEPLREFLTRPGGWLAILFVIVFKLPDVMVDNMKTPFLLKLGFSKEDLAKILQLMGMAATIVGAFAGGWLVAKMGLWKSLWVLGLLQAISNLGFWFLAIAEPTHARLVAVIAVENFCTGMVTAGFVAFLMSQCDHRFSATQYAILSGLMAVPRDIGGAFTGYLAEATGWSGFFAYSILAAAPGLALLAWMKPKNGDADTLSTDEYHGAPPPDVLQLPATGE